MTETLPTQSRAPAEPATPADEHTRLLTLVGELLQENQELRFKMAQLAQKTERDDRQYAEAAVVYRLLMP